MEYVLVIAVALAIAWRSATPAERERYRRRTRETCRQALQRVRGWWLEIEPFRETMRARTRFAPVTPALLVLHVGVFAAMLAYPRLTEDADALVAWGASVGPRTANGEWWRLITALFVHPRLIDLLLTLVALIPLGLIVERVVGPFAFGAAYLLSGIFANLFTVSVLPLTVTAGAAGAVAGVYAFMLSVSLWGVSQRPRLPLPLMAIKWLACCAALFTVYAVARGLLGVAVVGFLSGLLHGALVARGVNTRRAPLVRVAATVATLVAIAISTAVPLRGIADARGALEAISATEARTTTVFRTALAEFTDGRFTSRGLASLIDERIIPDLRTGHDRLATVDPEMVPDEQRPLLEAAVEYLPIREESWALRAKALRSGKLSTLRAADEAETRALEAFRRMTGPAGHEDH